MKKLLFTALLLLLSYTAKAHSVRVVSFQPSYLYSPYLFGYYSSYSPWTRPVYFTPYPKSYAAQLAVSGEALRVEWENYRSQGAVAVQNTPSPELSISGSQIVQEKTKSY